MIMPDEVMEFPEIDTQQIRERLKAHLQALTITIGERSVRYPRRLAAAAEYITAFYEDLGISVHTEPYRYRDMNVANVVAEIVSGPDPSARYILGAHYDSVNNLEVGPVILFSKYSTINLNSLLMKYMKFYITF